MAPTEVVTSTACTCNCEEGNRVQLPSEDVREEDDWQHCECTFCGPVLEDGSRRCKVKVSPVVKLRAASKGKPLPSFCGDCWDECRRQAGEAGKDEQGQAVAHVTP